MKPASKIILVLLGIAVVSLSEIGLMFWLGKRDVENFCRETIPGTPVARLSELAQKHNVRYVLPGLHEQPGTYLVVATTPRSFGRYTCRVRHDGNLVIEAH